MGLRTARLGDEIRDILARCLAGGQMNDPRLQFVTITAVKLTADLQLATVYYRVVNAEQTEETRAGLYRARGYFRNQLAEGLDVRRVPNLRFLYDKSVEHGSRIEKLLLEIKE